MASQFAWNADATWSRAGAMTRSVNPGTDVIQVTGIPQSGAPAAGAFIVVSSGTALSGMFYPGLFTAQAFDDKHLEGVLLFTAPAFADGTVTFNGQTVASVSGGTASLLATTLTTPLGVLTLNDVRYYPDRLEFTLAYDWTNLAVPRFEWGEWKSLGCQCQPKPDVFMTMTSAVDADGHVTERVKIYATGTVANFPVTAPAYFEVMVDDGGATATQVAWKVGGDTKYMRTYTRDTGTFSSWRPYQGRTDFVPLAGGTSISNYETRPVQTGVTDLVLNQSSHNTITLMVNDALTIQADALDKRWNKLVTLNLEAETETAVTWPEHIIWSHGTAPESLPKGMLTTVCLRFTNELVFAWVLGSWRRPQPERKGMYVSVGWTSSSKIYQYGEHANDLATVQIEDESWDVVYRESDGLFLIPSGSNLYYGADLSNLNKAASPFGLLTYATIRQSDNMIFISGRWFRNQSASAEGVFLWGVNPAELSWKQTSAIAPFKPICRQSDGIFMTHNMLSYYYGANPDAMSNVSSTGLAQIWHMAIRQSDGMIIVSGQGAKILYGTNPAALQSVTIPHTHGGAIFCRESDGMLVISLDNYGFLYGTSPSNLRLVRKPIEDGCINQSDGRMMFASNRQTLLFGNDPANLHPYTPGATNLRVLACNERTGEFTARGTKAVSGVSRDGIWHFTNPEDMFFSPFSSSHPSSGSHVTTWFDC